MGPGLCRLFGVPIEALPAILPTAGFFGRSRQAAGLRKPRRPAGRPVRPRLPAAGRGKITFGTGAFALALTGETPLGGGGCGLCRPARGGLEKRPPSMRWTADFSLRERRWSGCAASGCSTYSTRSTRSKVPLRRAGASCSRPHSPDLDVLTRTGRRGSRIGMDLATLRADLGRAVIEGIAFRAAELIDAFNEVTPCAKIAIDGGLTPAAISALFGRGHRRRGSCRADERRHLCRAVASGPSRPFDRRARRRVVYRRIAPEGGFRPPSARAFAKRSSGAGVGDPHFKFRSPDNDAKRGRFEMVIDEHRDVVVVARAPPVRRSQRASGRSAPPRASARAGRDWRPADAPPEMLSANPCAIIMEPDCRPLRNGRN